MIRGSGNNKKNEDEHEDENEDEDEDEDEDEHEDEGSNTVFESDVGPSAKLLKFPSEKISICLCSFLI